MIFWWLVAPGFKKNGMELKGDLAYCWGGKSTGYEFEGMLVNLPPSCTSVCFRVCIPVKERSFQKSETKKLEVNHPTDLFSRREGACTTYPTPHIAHIKPYVLCFQSLVHFTPHILYYAIHTLQNIFTIHTCFAHV